MMSISESSMKLRRPTINDIPAIEDIAKEQDFPLVQKFDSAAVIEKFDDIIAFAVLRRNVEAVLYCRGNTRQKVEALKMLIEKAKEDAKELGHNDIQVFAQEPKFADILLNHFNFRRMNGTSLMMEF